MRKIALACFIGGALMCTVALVCAPNFWWLSLLAGFAGGYVSYKFREVLQAIPVAWHMAVNKAKGSLGRRFAEIRICTEWLFHSPHPFLLFGILCGCLFFFLAAFWCIDGDIRIMLGLPMTNLPLALSMFFWIFCLSVVICGGSAFILADKALVEAGCIWQPTTELQRRSYTEDTKAGCQKITLTYATATKWALRGALGLLKETVGFSICLVGVFIWCVWKLLKLIHSQERLLCAIDGTLGGTVAYFWMASIAMTISEQTLLVVSGGLLGAAFGTLHKSIAEWLIKNELASA